MEEVVKARKKRIYPRRLLTESEKQLLIDNFGVLSYRELQPIMNASHQTIKLWYVELGLVKQTPKPKTQDIMQSFKISRYKNWLI